MSSSGIERRPCGSASPLVTSPQNEVQPEAEARAHGHECGDVGREMWVNHKQQSGDKHRPMLLLSAVHEQHETDTARNQGEHTDAPSACLDVVHVLSMRAATVAMFGEPYCPVTRDRLRHVDSFLSSTYL